MIRSFACKDTARLAQGARVARFANIDRVAYRKLVQLDQAHELRDLGMFPGNRLEALSGNRKGQHSIRINDQWRVCFRWDGTDAHDVAIVDYH